MNLVISRHHIYLLILFFSTLIFFGSVLVVQSQTIASASNSDFEVAKANGWLVSNQQSNGSFEVAGYEGFETSDAVAAIAASSQTSSFYDSQMGLNKILSLKQNGLTALDYLDEYTETNNSVANSCKLVVNVVSPLGMDASDFDPSNNSDEPFDLLKTIRSAKLKDGSYGLGVFNTTLTCALALFLEDGSVSIDTIGYIESTQASDGSFNFAGDKNILDGGADTTGLAIEVLVAGGRGLEDSSLNKAITYLATTINEDGSFSNFGSPDPNSTALALRGLNSAGINSDNRLWRDYFALTRMGKKYSGPSSWLISQQTLEGNFASPYDSFGVNTFATSQVVQALRANIFPVFRLDIFVPPEVEPINNPIEVGGKSIVDTSPDARAFGYLAATGSDSRDMTIIGSIVLIAGIGAVLISKRSKK